MDSADLTAAQLDATIASLVPRREHLNRLLARCIELGFPPGDEILVSARESAEAVELLIAELHRLYHEAPKPPRVLKPRNWRARRDPPPPRG